MRISDETYFQILTAIEEDWTTVVISTQAPLLAGKQQQRVGKPEHLTWCKQNCIDKFIFTARTCYFKNPADATWFSLMWK